MTTTSLLRRQQVFPLVARLTSDAASSLRPAPLSSGVAPPEVAPPEVALAEVALAEVALAEVALAEVALADVAPRNDAPPPPFAVTRSDAVAWLRTLPSASVDLVVTDPPYESLEKHRAVGTTTRLKHSKSSSNDWFSIFPNERFPELFTELYRVLKKNSHLYLFCDPETMFVAKPLAETAGFRFWKPLVWDKRKIGLGYHYRSRYELILFFEKGKRKLHDLGQPDIIEAPRIEPRRAGGAYPSEKPVVVSEILVRQSTEPGALVIDPFMGSASAGVAAVSLGRRFAGCDVSEKAIQVSTGRLEAALSRTLGGQP